MERIVNCQKHTLAMAGEGRGSFWAMALSLLFTISIVLLRSILGSISLGLRLLFTRLTRTPHPPSPTPQNYGLGSQSLGGAEAKASAVAKGFQFALYEGEVFHGRQWPVARKFRYKVRHALVNLEDPPAWFAASAGHHLSFQEAQAIAATNGPIYLLTTPTSFGYEQNPISVYYCYNDGGNVLVKCIAEVTNTPWGERVIFVFDPKSDMVAKSLHVSPFMDALSQWKMQASPPGQHLVVSISVHHPELGNYFIATLTSARVGSSLPDAEAYFWLMPQKVAVWIYWQAILLLWKGVTFFPHPKYAFDSSMGPWPQQNKQAQSICKERNICGGIKAAPGAAQSNFQPVNEQRYCTWVAAQGWPWK